MLFIKKYLKKKRRHNNEYLTLGGCIYHLAVRCLDFLDFGSIVLPKTIPRIHVWKGDMVKNFSDMTIGRDGKYGARSFIEENETCYAKRDNNEPHETNASSGNINTAAGGDHDTKKQDCTDAITNKHTMPLDGDVGSKNLAELLQKVSQNSLSDKMKQNIVSAFENFMKGEEMNMQSKATGLVLDVVRLMVDTNRESGDTERMVFSDENQNSNVLPNGSQNTLKLTSTEASDPINKEVVVMTGRQQVGEEVCSQQSIRSEYYKKDEVGKVRAERASERNAQQPNPLVQHCTDQSEKPPVDVTPICECDNPELAPNRTEGYGASSKERNNAVSSASLDHLLHNNSNGENITGNQVLPDFNDNSTPDLNEKPAEKEHAAENHEAIIQDKFTGFKYNMNTSKPKTENIAYRHQISIAGMNITTKDIGHESQINSFLSDIMGDECTTAVVKEVLQDGTCCVSIETSGSWDEVTVPHHSIQIIQPRKNDNVKILYGPMYGLTGKIIGVDGRDAIVRVEGIHDLKVLDLMILGSLRVIQKADEVIVLDNSNIPIYANINNKTDMNIYKNTDWCSYIDEARKKYHFNDDSIPSFRLFDYHDEKGTYIEEPVLWRPIGMDTETYNAKIESAKHNFMLIHKSNYKESIDSLSTKHNTSSEYNESIIQCAQRQPSYCDLTDSPEDNTIAAANDLDRPCLGLIANIESSSYKTPTPKRCFKEEIIGRKLFQDDNLDNKNSSQEVQILGTKIFSESCKNMCNQTDDLYNTHMTLGNGSSKSGKENLYPKRILQPSKFVSSPYDSNIRRPIISIEYKMYEVLTTLCDDDEYCLKWAIYFDNCKVSLEQLGKSLKQGGWVESFVINSFCRKLFRENHPKQSGKHFFFNTVSDYFLEKWKSEDARLDWKDRALKCFKGASLARPLHLAERLYFPAVFNSHWFVFAVDIKYRCFLFLDSIYGKHDSYQVIASELMIKNFKLTWEEAGLKAIRFNDFEKVYPVVPKQKGGDNCGIHCMKLMELYCPRNPAQYAFSDQDIPYFRMRYAIDMLFSKFNTEDYAKNLVKSFNLKAYKERRAAVAVD